MLLNNSFRNMEADKEEFKRLVELMGWSQTEAARRLYKTPSAINHLVNPDHPNKPTQTTMQLLKLIIASEHPCLLEGQSVELRDAPDAARDGVPRLSLREQEMIENLRRLPLADQEKVHTVISALLRPYKPGKPKK
ncbi:MAG TPA: hypothetical protein VGO59_10750 [Verrucomicrobiae bacterium]|jgi:hypothetical protein